MDNQGVVDQTAAPAAEPASQQAAGSDPYALDETKFASLSPEQRASLDPVLNEWRERAKGEVEKTRKNYEEKYKPHVERAEALDQLVRNPGFQQWWQQQQQAAIQANPGSQTAISATKPQDIATQQEWQEALYDLNTNNDASKWNNLQARLFTLMATPVVRQLKEGQEELRTTLEMKGLFESHADAKDLDKIGQDPTDPDSPSLLEVALNLAEERGKPLEWGYQLAKKWSGAMSAAAKQEAMGLVQSKKDSVTSGPSTSRGGSSAVIEVGDSEELMERSMKWSLDNPNQPMPKFVIRQNNPSQRDQKWAQRT